MAKNISLYIKYPTAERLQILRERVKSWNEIDKMKEIRLSKLAKPDEITAYIMGDSEMIADIDKRWKEVSNRKEKAKPLEIQQKPVKNEDSFTLPSCVSEVLAGERYPDIYDCTKQEQDILYNKRFLELYQQYRTAKSDLSAQITMNEITDLVKGLLK